MKYIITKNDDVIIFSGGLSHAEVAGRFGGDVKRAGTFRCDPESIICEGGSISLKIAPYMGEDTQEIVNRMTNF